jgi:hypothetical protein
LKITELAIKSVQNVDWSSVIGTFYLDFNSELLINERISGLLMLDQSGEHSAMKKQMLTLPVLVVLKIPFSMEQIYLQ